MLFNILFATFIFLDYYYHIKLIKSSFKFNIIEKDAANLLKNLNSKNNINL